MFLVSRMIGGTSSPALDASLVVQDPTLDVAHDECDPDQGDRDAEPDAEDVARDKGQVQPVAAVGRFVREFNDVDGEEAGHETQRQEDDRHDREHHDRLALPCRVLRLVAHEVRFQRVGVFLLQVEDVRETGVDAFGLLGHPVDVE